MMIVPSNMYGDVRRRTYGPSASRAVRLEWTGNSATQCHLPMQQDRKGTDANAHDILIRSVGQAIREVHGAASWPDVERRAEALWRAYADATGIPWAHVAERVQQAWRSAPSSD
ncbi:hypothetical protein [Lysobacter arvi]|uniref:Uncharacterized protein n=1 Tax=Lysobacter arvi TaxID=3038776 RepID=A0ABU1CBA4_9GAMM|nr:hypothetical protein [Lysobacter arvi]MDR0182027.1 hypothetical protein [Lysobacter arvi]